jgi:hypothetical protein
MPHPQFISAGKSSQGMPVLSTNRIPVNACRWVIGGRPPFFEGTCGGNSGSMNAHRSSGNSGLATAVPPQRIPPQSEPTSIAARFC